MVIMDGIRDDMVMGGLVVIGDDNMADMGDVDGDKLINNNDSDIDDGILVIVSVRNHPSRWAPDVDLDVDLC